MKFQCIIFSAILLVVLQVRANEEKEQFEQLSLEQLLDVKVSVASTKATTSRLSPGIVTVITSDEIMRSGAKDLIDILSFVPGLEFGSDVQGVIGLASRGLWAHEGKILLLWDEMELNETLYSNSYFGNRFPLQAIEKIEIIRGPGSVRYGGSAGLGVIKITSKKGSSLRGVQTTALAGQEEQDLGVSVGDRIGEYEAKAIVYGGVGQRSDQTYTDSAGSTFNLRGRTDLDPSFFNVSLEDKKLSISALYERYHTRDQTALDQSLSMPVGVDFDTFNSNLKYRYDVMPGWVFIPEFSWKRDVPWRLVDVAGFENPGIVQNRMNTRSTYRLNNQVTASNSLSFDFGVEYREDRAVDLSQTTFTSTGTTAMSLYENSVYAEGEYAMDFGTLNAGARYEQNSGTDPSLVPRLSFVRQLSPTMVGKVLYSESFRSPGIENIDISSGAIVPEKIRASELEISDQLAPSLFLSMNLFQTVIVDPIIYASTGTNGNQYINFPKTGSEGFELELKQKDEIHFARMSYSYYQAINDEVPYYGTGHSGEHLALSQHKITLVDSIHLADRLTLNPSLVYLSSGHQFDFSGVTGTNTLQSYPERWNVGAYLRKEDLWIQHLEGGPGVANLMNQTLKYGQPYNSMNPASPGHPAMPLNGRDFYVKVDYRVPF